MSDVLDHLAHERKMVRTSIELMKKTEQRLTAAITLLRPSFPGWKDPTEKTKAPDLKVKVPVLKIPAKKASKERPMTTARKERYEKLTEVAQEAVSNGQDPVKAVSHAFGWKESTATTTMVEARRAGFDVPKKSTNGNGVVHASPSAPSVAAHAD